jgi:hypothetical protein
VPGERVNLTVTLDAGRFSIVGLQGDLGLSEQAPVVRTDSGEPACRVATRIDKPDSRFGFQPAFCSGDCTHVRALVLSFTDLDPIPDGATIFNCTLQISESAPPGVYPLTLVAPDASDRRGGEIPIGSISGTLTVRPAGGIAAGIIGPSTGSSGCQLASTRSQTGWRPCALALVAVALSLCRRRTRS